MKKKCSLIIPYCIAGFVFLFNTSCSKDKNPGERIIDIDGNVYSTVVIGTQDWMAENLKVTRFLDSTSIAMVADSFAWSSLTTPAYCNYNNEEKNASTYGRLYNWLAIDDPRGVCPSGWHVPTRSEWNTLSA
jgi:uncharacterized protein (TIGR02145 family)